MKAINTFEKQQQSIQSMIAAADVYTQYVIADMRKKPVNPELITKIVSQNGLSTLNYSWRLYLTEEEYNDLRKDGRTTRVCEQIVMSVYTTIETYLISKFKEYLRFQLSEKSDSFFEAVYKRVSFRSLSETKNNYRDFLDIHLPSFGPEVRGFGESWFKPDSGWDALHLLSTARNEIAHEGACRSYDISYIIDAYAPFHFAYRWVCLFDRNFDLMIYDGRRSQLVIEHDERYVETKA